MPAACYFINRTQCAACQNAELLHRDCMQWLWVQVLASVPDLDIVAYLPLFLGSLMECLTDPLVEVRSKATKVLQVRRHPCMTA